MKVGLMVTGIGVPKGREQNVSGHVQLPMHTATLLREAGVEVRLITTCFREDYVLPKVVPGPAVVPLHFVTDGRRRGEVGKQNIKAGYYPLAMVKHLREILRLTRDLKLDMLHLFGADRMTLLAGLLNMLGSSCPVISTAYKPPHPGIWAPLYRKSKAIACSTQFVANKCASVGGKAQLVRPGITRDFRTELNGCEPGERKRVLFWREGTYEQGCDLVLTAFDALAPQYPELSFDLALRENRFEVPGVQALCEKHENVSVFRFPYPDEISLARLIAESLCVVLPFRKLTIQPQLAIAESLKAGVATICTELGSCSELVLHEKTGLVVPAEDDTALTSAIKELIEDAEGTLRMGQEAERDIEARWNWNKYTEELLKLYDKTSS
ncbi:glycosyltransferase family 4 protein [Bythopirellula goksoeyrii]|uniref:D-inositol-3-phosphate glycosyltransferase n=1 Tax=Bythopirellula goksoeyrii TaxID=1400387 RepID=A0A5B9QKU4_9BACT|nr:glycosyltransferase family 4 protein [Bythopirellula goksoeyrii]QEG34693.1 D-inositol-3-phosphate glycosyltransferase [Bythopirellula goksoeyrii]